MTQVPFVRRSRRPGLWALLLVAAPCWGGAAWAEEPEQAAPARNLVSTRLAGETAGAWQAWTVRTTNPWTRRILTHDALQRVGPGQPVLPPSPPSPDAAAPSGSLWRGGPGAPMRFRLHPQGWLVATCGDATRVFAPTSSEGATRTDLYVSALSRFLPSGFLSVRLESSAGQPSLGVITFARLTATGLAHSLFVATFQGPDLARVFDQVELLAEDSAEAVVVRWCVPNAGPALRGGVRMAHATGQDTPLPADSAPPTVRVAAVQVASVFGDVPTNLERLELGIAEAARGGAKFVVLPETAIQGYLSQDLKTTWHVPGKPRADAFLSGVDPRAAAFDRRGARGGHAALARLGSLAFHWGVWLTAPFLEREGPEASVVYYNSVLLYGPDGREAAHYRKLSPWPHPEQSWATAGNLGLAAAQTPYGRVGLAVCFDVHTVFQRYADEQPLWTLLYPIAWVSAGDDAAWFGKELPERAKEAGFHVVGANWSVDQVQPWHGYGWSTIIARDGRVLAQAKTKLGTEVVLADLPFDAQR